MKKKCLIPILVFNFLFILLVFVSSCAQKAKTHPNDATMAATHRIVILPFKDQAALKGINIVTHCAVCGSVFTTGNVTKGAANHLTEKTTALIQQKGSVTVVSIDRLEAVKIELQLNDQALKMSQAAFTGAVGAKLGGDVVLTGNVYRFEQRIGTAFAADTPASVGFDVYMISAPGGRLLWHARFDEHQKSLFENLLKLNTFVERKGKWLTAEELAEYGLKKIIERSPIP